MRSLRISVTILVISLHITAHAATSTAQVAVRFSPVACRATFPFAKEIRRPLDSQHSFDLFAFTVREFDPQKPSLLYVNGGVNGLRRRLW
jgi:hypothetical protein